MERDEIDQKARDMLCNQRSAKPFFNRCELKHLYFIKESIDEIIPQKEIEEKEKEEKLAQKQSIIDQVKQLLLENDINATEIYGKQFDALDDKSTIKPKRDYSLRLSLIHISEPTRPY